MADIKIIDFVKTVEQGRQRLINHCNDNGKEADDSLSLSQIVDINNTINQEQGGFEGRWIDIDGTILKKEYVQDGGSFTPPPTPSYDSEYLEFVEWVSARDYTDVHSDIDMGASYKSKIDENGRRNTYLFCAFDSTTGLNPTIKITQSTSSSTTYVDWGDGNTNEYTGSTSPTVTHTYASEGQYVIKIWCNGQYYLRGGSGTSSMLGSANLNGALLKLYIGENYNQIWAGLLYQTQNLQVINMPNDVSNTNLPNHFTYLCYSLRTMVIPSNFTTQSYGTSGTHGLCYQCYTLKYLILPNTITQINGNLCSACHNIEKVILPASVLTYYTSSSFNSCYALKKVVLPNDLTTVDQSMFENCRQLTNITLPPTISRISSRAFFSSAIETLTIPNTSTFIESAFGSNPILKYIFLPIGYNSNANLTTSYNSLTKECLINIATALQDNGTTQTTKTITFSQYAKKVFTTTYLDEQGNEVTYGTEGAVSLLQFIINKNWTVTFS